MPTFSEDNLKNLCTERETIANEMVDYMWEEFTSKGITNHALKKNSKTDNFLTKLGQIGRQIENSPFALENNLKFKKTWKIFNFDKNVNLDKVGKFTSYDSVQLSNWQSFMKSLNICMSYNLKDIEGVDKLYPGLKELFLKVDNQIINNKGEQKNILTQSEIKNIYSDINFETKIQIDLSFHEKLSLVKEFPQSLPFCKENEAKILCSEIEINNYGDRTVYFWNKDNELHDFFYFAYDNGKSFNQFHKLIDTSYESINYVLSSHNSKNNINKTIESIEIIGNEIIGQGKYKYDVNIDNFRKIGTWIYETQGGSFFKVSLDNKGVLNKSLTFNKNNLTKELKDTNNLEKSKKINNEQNTIEISFDANKSKNYCNEKWTKRGELDVQMYEYCHKKNEEANSEILDLISKYKKEKIELFNEIIKYSFDKWINNRRDYEFFMIPFEIKKQSESYLNIMWNLDNNKYEKNEYQICKKKWLNSEEPLWNMVEYCLEKN